MPANQVARVHSLQELSLGIEMDCTGSPIVFWRAVELFLDLEEGMLPLLRTIAGMELEAFGVVDAVFV